MVKILQRILSGAIVAVAVWVTTGPSAVASPLFTQTQTVSTDAAPVEQTFTPTAMQAGSVDVIVADAGFPAPLDALRVAVSQGVTVITTALANQGTPATVTLTFTATAGINYQIRLIGRPNTSAGAGSAVVTITPHGTPATVYATFPAGFSSPLAPGSGGLLPDQTLNFAAAGTYNATLTDLALPAPFSTGGGLLTAAIFQGATQIATINPGASPTPVVIPAAGNYTLRVIAAAVSGNGLFGLRIVGAAAPNTVVYPPAGSSGVTAVGTVSGPTPIANPSTQTVALAVADLKFPAALATLGAVLTGPDGSLIARQCVVACGPADVLSGTAPSGGLSLWRAVAAASGTGSYSINVTAGASTLYTDVESASSSGNSPSSAFSFAIPVASAGNYTVTVTDLQAPAALASVQFAVFQNGQQLTGGTSTTAGSVTVPLTAGQATVNVVAQTGAVAASGIFGLQVQTVAASPVTIFGQAQAVGAFNGTQAFTVPSGAGGPYAITLTDAQWPAAFGTLDLFVTQGAQILGKIYGGGTIAVNLGAGDYQLTYTTVPDTTEKAGLYAFNVQAAPLPTVTLSASPTTVTSGGSTALTWTSSDATTCAGTGGISSWQATQGISGTAVMEGPLTATTTFTLACSGAGGTSTPVSVTVTVTAPGGGGGGGGGGAFGELGLLALAGVAALRASRKAAPSRLRFAAPK